MLQHAIETAWSNLVWLYPQPPAQLEKTRLVRIAIHLRVGAAVLPSGRVSTCAVPLARGWSAQNALHVWTCEVGTATRFFSAKVST